MSKIWLMSNWNVLYNFSHFLPLLYGPLLYLFVKHLFQSQRITLRDFLQFLPATIALIGSAFTSNNLLPDSAAFVFVNPVLRLFFLCASIIWYHGLAYSLWKKHQNKFHDFYADTTTFQMNWVKQLVFISALVSTIIAVALFLLFIHYPNGHQYRYGFVVLSICIYWFSYTTLTKPALFTVIKGNADPKVKKEFSIPILKVYRPNIKYANSVLSTEDAESIITSLGQVMKEEKLYLQSGLTIIQLADSLKCSRHHLSQVLNDNLQQSYSDYINGLRTEEAKHLLQNPKYDHIKISSIAYDSGFNSLSSFNEVFKKITGKTPSDYRKETIKELKQKQV